MKSLKKPHKKPLVRNREALAVKPLSVRLKEIQTFVKRLKKPGDSDRIKALEILEAEQGLPPGMAREVLDLILRRLTLENLKTYEYAQKRDPVLRKTRILGCIVPGNVPDPFIACLVGGWLNAHALFFKVSRKNRNFCNHLLGSIRRVSPAFAKSVQVTTHEEIFFKAAKGFDAVIAFGSDQTLRQIRQRLSRHIPLIERGHRVGASIVYRSQMSQKGFNGLALRCAKDVWLYDQRGCVSPQVIFVEGQASAFALKLETELLKLYEKFGPVKRSYEMVFERRVLLDRLQMEHLDNNGIFLVRWPRKSDEPVVYEILKGGLRFAHAGQIIAVQSFSNLSQVKRSLSGVWDHLQCVSVAGSEDEIRRTQRLFKTSSVLFYTSCGEMQNPPLGWELKRGVLK